MPTRVFISYSHDTEEHRERVRALAVQLRSEGIDVRTDRDEPAPPQGWPRWMDEQLDAAEFVLVVCTPTYRRRVEGGEQLGRGKGATWEGMLVQQHLYDSNSLNTKLIPVLFEGESDEAIPRVLRPFTYYRLPRGYDDLYRHLTGQHATPPVPLGQVRPMPVAAAVPLAGGTASTSEPPRAGGQVIDNRGAVIGTMINVNGTLNLGSLPTTPPPTSPRGSSAPVAAAGGEGWDVFLSHAPADAAAVHELALELHGLGLRVFLDAWEIGPGDVVVHRLDQGLRESRTGVLVVSSASLRWPQVMQEYAVLLTRAVERGQRLIPVVLELGEGEELPPMLATRMPVDLRGVTGEARRLKVESIARAIRGERPGPPRG